jgi:hypothetical protein
MTMEYNSESLLEMLPVEILTEHVTPTKVPENYDPALMTLIKHFGYSATTTDVQKKEYENLVQGHFAQQYKLCLVNKYFNRLYKELLNKQIERLCNVSLISYNHLNRYLALGGDHLCSVLNGKIKTNNNEEVTSFTFPIYLYSTDTKRYGFVNNKNSLFSVIQFSLFFDTKIIKSDNAPLGIVIKEAFEDKNNNIFFHERIFDFLIQNSTNDDTKEKIGFYKQFFNLVTKQNVHNNDGLKIKKLNEGDEESWEYSFFLLIGDITECNIPFHPLIHSLIQNKIACNQRKVLK